MKIRLYGGPFDGEELEEPSYPVLYLYDPWRGKPLTIVDDDTPFQMMSELLYKKAVYHGDIRWVFAPLLH